MYYSIINFQPFLTNYIRLCAGGTKVPHFYWCSVLVVVLSFVFVLYVDQGHIVGVGQPYKLS